VFDGFNIATDLFHVSSDVFEVCLEFNDARFHINSSGGFCAVIEFSLMIGAIACRWRDLTDRQPDVMALHGLKRSLPSSPLDGRHWC
jgi:hypothetical protein